MRVGYLHVQVDKQWYCCYLFIAQWTKIHVVQSKKEGKEQESIQSSTTPDPGYQWESDNFTIRLTCMVTFIRGNPLVNNRKLR